VKRRIVVGSRGSRLALAQAESVMASIKRANPNIKLGLKKIITAGDRDRHTRPDHIGVAIFVKELEQALFDGVIDLAVHNLKDMPTEVPKDLQIQAVTPRLDPRDTLVAKSRLSELAPGSKIGTGSLRRSAQLHNYRPDLEVCNIRGNVDTRLCKVASGEIEGVIIAAAAMARLGWEGEIAEYLPLDHFLPAVGQGVLALESRIDDREVADLVSPLNHLPTWQSITAERVFLRLLGGGCRAPIAALGTVTDSILKLEGMIADVNGTNILRASEEGNALYPEEIGERLAEKILSMGASEFIDEAKLR
jgi:hydroxymethylbilane synthase